MQLQTSLVHKIKQRTGARSTIQKNFYLYSYPNRRLNKFRNSLSTTTTPPSLQRRPRRKTRRHRHRPAIHLSPKRRRFQRHAITTPESDITARLYLPPKNDTKLDKLPLVVYFHVGSFFVSSPFDPKCHNYLNALVAQARVLAVSVNYRKAPEHPLPTAYNDSWAALHWIISHHGGEGPEPWLNHHADFARVFLAGESAGANIAHNLALAAGEPEFGLGIGLLGLGLVHPFLWGTIPIGSEESSPDKKALVDRIWPLVCPSSESGHDDPRINPVAKGAPSLAGIGCGRVLVCVAEKDVLRDRGRLYYDVLSRCGWMGVAEIDETIHEDYLFYLNNLDGQNTKDLIRRLTAFFNRDMPPLI